MNKTTEALKKSQDFLRRLAATCLYDKELGELLTTIHEALEGQEPIYTNTNHGFVMTDRNFSHQHGGMIYDNNFDHDASIQITGDFADIDEKEQYAKMIVKALNSHSKQPLATQEKIIDEFNMAIQSDLEHGVKILNQQAVEKFKQGYPELNKFWAWLNTLEGDE